jgi:flagellar biosynthetic protein FliQ
VGGKMSVGLITNLIRGGIQQVLVLAAPVLFVGLIVGLVVSIFQTITSIQEQTLTFVPKILAILAMVALLSAWMFNSMSDYTITLFEMIPRIAR